MNDLQHGSQGELWWWGQPAQGAIPNRALNRLDKRHSETCRPRTKVATMIVDFDDFEEQYLWNLELSLRRSVGLQMQSPADQDQFILQQQHKQG